MDKQDQDILRKNRTTFANNLDLQEVLQYLVENNILNDRMVDKILKENQTQYGQNVSFLVLLSKRGPEAFQHFRNALKETEQLDLAKLLDRNGIKSSYNCTTPTKTTIGSLGDTNESYSPQSFNFGNSSITNSSVFDTPIKSSPRAKNTEPKCLYEFKLDFNNLKSTSSVDDLWKKVCCATTLPLSTNHINLLPPKTNNHKANTMQSEECDGPTVESLTVARCCEEFVINHSKNCYPLFDQYKGLCLIVSVEKFEDNNKFEDRTGGEVDRSRIELLFHQLSYKVFNLINPTGREIANTLQKFAEWEEHQNYDSCIVVLMSHGENGVVYGRDGTSVSINKIVNSFNNVNCPYLLNRPKLFFVQACRGDEVDQGVETADTPRKRMKFQLATIQGKLPSVSDVFIGYATLPGYIAMRNTSKGSWYIQALVEEFAAHAKDQSLNELMTRVNNRVSKREGVAPGTEYHRCKEMSEFRNMLCKNFYFFPGFIGKSKTVNAL